MWLYQFVATFVVTLILYQQIYFIPYRSFCDFSTKNGYKFMMHLHTYCHSYSFRSDHIISDLFGSAQPLAGPGSDLDRI